MAQSLTPEAALKRLMEGNERYKNDQMQTADTSSVRREALVSRQAPFAVILGCSDSRVSPEILFDQGIGDLFVVRVAGNVCGPIELDSIEYAPVYLDSVLIMVLGHEGCAAVKAVATGKTKDIESIATMIGPAIEEDRNNLENAVKSNIRYVVEQLRKSVVISRLIKRKKIDVVGGYYQLSSGEVILLDR